MWKPAVCYQWRIIWIIRWPRASPAEVSSVQEHWVRQAALQMKVKFFPLIHFQKSFLGTLQAIASHPWKLHCHGNILTRTLGTKNHLSELGDDTHLTKWQLFRVVVVILSDCLPFTDGSAPKTTQPSDNWSQFGTILHSRIRRNPFQRANSHSFVSFKKLKECIRYPIDGETVRHIYFVI